MTYTGKGEDFSEFGVAQGRKRLGPANHYFELEIIDPGRSCYVALGVTRKDYPANMHPGWDRGSIAYHAGEFSLYVTYNAIAFLTIILHLTAHHTKMMQGSHI